MLRLAMIVVASVSTSLAAQSATDTASVQMLRFSEKDWATSARGVSADGARVIVGSDGGGWVWTAERSERLVGRTPKPRPEGQAISGDGRVMGGMAGFPEGKRGVKDCLVRWSGVNEPGDLGVLPGSGRISSSAVRSMSSDGAVVVGVMERKDAGQFRAFRWSAGGGMQDLGLPGGMRSAEANGVSADGSVVVGTALNDQGSPASAAFRWTANGIEKLAGLPADRPTSAQGVSSDGRVIVGNWRDQNGTGYRWENGTVTRLRAIDRHEGKVNGVSGDGSVCVGSSDSTSGQRAVVWGRSGKLYVLEDLLKEQGATFAGLKLNSAVAASADGRVIVGSGGMTDADGSHRQVGFIARLKTPVE